LRARTPTTIPATITNKTIKKATGMPTDNPTIKPKFDPPSPFKKGKSQQRIKGTGIKPEDEVP